MKNLISTLLLFLFFIFNSTIQAQDAKYTSYCYCYAYVTAAYTIDYRDQKKNWRFGYQKDNIVIEPFRFKCDLNKTFQTGSLGSTSKANLKIQLFEHIYRANRATIESFVNNPSKYSTIRFGVDLFGTEEAAKKYSTWGFYNEVINTIIVRAPSTRNITLDKYAYPQSSHLLDDIDDYLGRSSMSLPNFSANQGFGASNNNQSYSTNGSSSGNTSSNDLFDVLSNAATKNVNQWAEGKLKAQETFTLGMEAFKQKQYDLALTYFEQTLAYDKNASSAAYYIDEINNMERGRSTKALENTRALSAKDVIEKFIEAAGGKSRLEGIEYFKIVKEVPGTEVFGSSVDFKNKISEATRYNSEGTKIFESHISGGQGYYIREDGSKTNYNQQYIAKKFNSSPIPELDSLEEGNYKYEGIEKFNGVSCHVIFYNRGKSYNSPHKYYDIESGLLIGESIRGTYTKYYTNFKEVSGIIWPFEEKLAVDLQGSDIPNSTTFVKELIIK